MDDGQLPFVAGPLAPTFARRVVTMNPGGEQLYDETEWEDSIVVVRRGEVEVEGLCGNRRRFQSGDVLWLVGLPLRALHNPGAQPAELVAVSRTPSLDQGGQHMQPTNIVTREQWLKERTALLEREKELTRLGDRLAEDRRRLPWVRVEKDYRFQTADGEVGLADLFAGRNQLVVYHFMLGPDDTEGCPSCSFLADSVDPVVIHVEQRDVTFTAVSRAPRPVIEAYQARMGWSFPWVSSAASDFNFDFGVSFTEAGASYNYGSLTVPGPGEAHGISVFARDDDGAVYHTYSSYGRGGEALLTAYRILDLVPKGRDEADLGFTMGWVRRHDEYEGPATR